MSENKETLEQKKRSDIPDRYKWRLTDIYPGDSHWQAATEAVLARLPELTAYRGRLNTPAGLSECLALCNELGHAASHVAAYAYMKHHEDMSDPQYQSMKDQATSCCVKMEAAAAFIEPEILAADEAVLEDFLRKEPVYGHYIHDLLRTKAHVRSAEVEELLANASEMAMASGETFAMLENADMKFGSVTDEDGREIELTLGRFISLMESGDRAVRENAFRTFYSAWAAQKNTLASTYSGSVKADIFFARARGYGSAQEAALFGSNIPLKVCESLVSEVNAALPHMHRYMELRKARLGVSELHMYDLYTPIVKDADTKVVYEDAKATVLAALAPLGEEYLSHVRRGFDEGWIDVYETAHKHSGAYSWDDVYGVHPFILLNYDDKLDDMYTLAHEIGHALHTCYSDAAQPYIYSRYSTFVAEVASTVNEALLTNYLLDTLTDEVQRAYIINHYLDQFRTTLFRQTMFAEFEMTAHEMSERGEALTAESLCRIYRALNVKYYGESMVVDDEIDMEWARIPHFYDAFYVFQYATGMSAALALSQGILTQGTPAVEAYIEFLKSGASDYPINVLKKAGVDMSDRQPVRAAMEVFAGLVDKIEER